MTKYKKNDVLIDLKTGEELIIEDVEIYPLIEYKVKKAYQRNLKTYSKKQLENKYNFELK